LRSPTGTIREGCAFRTAWDAVAIALVLVSSALIPYQIVFDGSVSVRGTILLYLVDMFFLGDIWLNFRTTFREAGVEITDRSRIATHYVRSTLPVDIVANAPIELIFLAAPEASIGGVPLIVLGRALRLLRIVRLFLIIARWERMGWTNPGYLRILKFVGVVAIAIHWLACGWFLTSAVAHFPTDCWVVRCEIRNAPPADQYIRSLYWTITTMTTVGYGDITPARSTEYIVTMAIMLLGASMYAFIIGNVASLLSNLDSAKAGYWHRMESATEYLRCRGAPKELGNRVRNYYEYLWDQHRGLREDTFFADLPGPLRLEVLLHLTRDLLNQVPLFKHAPPRLRDVLLMALEPRTLDPTSLIAQAGEVSSEIVFISQGTMEIVKDGTVVDTLTSGDYFGDLSLVLGEARTATVRTATYCEVFVLSEDAFARIRKDHPEMRDVQKKMSSGRSEKLAALILDGIVL